MRIVAYIDQSAYAPSVCSHAVWAAQRLGMPVELVHAISLPASSENRDLSGYFAIDAPESVLEDRVQLDETRNRAIVEDGHRLLDTAAGAIRTEGVTQVSQRLFQGTISEHLQQHHDEIALVVVGKRGEDAARDPNHLGSNIERVVRSAHRPVLISALTFEPFERAIIAWDGGRSVTEAVRFISTHELLAGVATTLLHVGDGRGSGLSAREDVRRQLESGGIPVDIVQRTGPVTETILQIASELPADLVVMGAYGHSRIRQLVVGSTTTEVLLACPCSVLVVH